VEAGFDIIDVPRSVFVCFAIIYEVNTGTATELAAADPINTSGDENKREANSASAPFLSISWENSHLQHNMSNKRIAFGQ
jgi:hypothetical protein